ncbi:MAG: hypothetical protein RR140_01340 [Clostridia bacterium]
MKVKICDAKKFGTALSILQGRTGANIIVVCTTCETQKNIVTGIQNALCKPIVLEKLPLNKVEKAIENFNANLCVKVMFCKNISNFFETTIFNGSGKPIIKQQQINLEFLLK